MNTQPECRICGCTEDRACALRDPHSALSRAFRRAVIRYDLKPLETLLALLLCEESFDLGRTSAAAGFQRWARTLGMEPRKLAPVWRSLVQLLIVDHNAAENTFELRPDAKFWSRTRSSRVQYHKPGSPMDESELPLRDSRELAESLSDQSRESALLGPAPDKLKLELQPPPHNSESGRVREHTGENLPAAGSWWDEVERLGREQPVNKSPAAVHNPAEKSGRPDNSGQAATLAATQVADRIFPVAQEKAVFGPQNRREPPRPEKSGQPLASLALVPKAELAKRGEQAAAAWSWLKEIDVVGHLETRRSAEQWRDLCETDPRYVTEALRKSLNLAKVTIRDPLAYLARRCRDERKFT